MPDLETEEEAAERILINSLNKSKDNVKIEMSSLDKIVKNKENEFSTKLNKTKNDIKKIDNYIKENNDKNFKKEKEYNEILLKCNESIKELVKTKERDDFNELKRLNRQNDIVEELESKLNEKKENIKTLKDNKNLGNIIKIKNRKIGKLEKSKINYDKEIKELGEELTKSYKYVNEKKRRI